MKKGENYNRPQKGSRTSVEPIRRLKDVQAIAKMLSDNPRNHLLFVMGTNNGLRTGDLLRLKVGDVRRLKVGDALTIMEGKTGKSNILVVNKTIFKSLSLYLDKIKPADEDFLFRSRKGTRPITIQCANNLVKKWTSAVNLRGNYGAHTLRKTWGYVQRTVFGVGFEIICKRFNHSSPSITMRYLGIEDREVQNILMNEVG